MPTLLIRFSGRRYQATPWGHHVNEGLVEWPPSPWRLLRALISVGYTKGIWDASGPPPLARSLLGKLADVLPTYYLPAASGAHSRHYMPLGTLDKGQEKRTLVFDTWARIDQGEMAVIWGVDLDGDERCLLSDLATRLGYLGRAESWVEARLAEARESVAEPNCFPSEALPGWGWEEVAMLAPQGEHDFSRWRQQAIAAVESAHPLPAPGKKETKKDQKLKAQREKALEPYPVDLLDALQKDTAWLQRCGWSQPPGSRRVHYWRKTDALRITVPVAPRYPARPPVQAMLLSMATASGNRHALPPVIYTLVHGERLHKALVKKAGSYNRVLSGCDESGTPLRGRHEHAHVLPLDLDHDGQLDHFLVWAPMGLDAVAQNAVRAVRKTFAKNTSSLYLALAACCADLKDLDNLQGPYGDALRSLLGLNGAIDWVSRTPFVPPRHLKPRGKNTLEGQVAAELVSRGLPQPAEVKVLDPRETPENLNQRHFTRRRKLGPPPVIDCGFSLRLRFNHPLRGPLCLGYGSHYGLGLFAALP